MIQPPRRAVTRFFVPLIDVLILLFCMFLLLPIVSQPDDGKAGQEAVDTGLPTDVKVLQERLQMAEARVRSLMADRAREAERTIVPVLQVDGRDGKLFYFDKSGPKPVRVEVETQADAQVFIDRQKQTAKGQPVHFLILMPRELSGYPTGPQRKQYKDWFDQRKAAYTIDDPWAAK